MVSVSSNRVGGVNALFMGGSGRFVNRAVAYQTRYAIGTADFRFSCSSWRVATIMRRIFSALSVAALSASLLGLAGCGEDNEAIGRQETAKSPPAKFEGAQVIPQSQSQADYFKNNPGTTGEATSSRGKKAAAKTP